MTAETKPSFDPEAEASRAHLAWEQDPNTDLAPTSVLLMHMAALARRAFEAGAADMRERAFQAVTEIRWASPEAEVRPSRESALYDAAMRVRSLPLSEPR